MLHSLDIEGGLKLDEITWSFSTQAILFCDLVGSTYGLSGLLLPDHQWSTMYAALLELFHLGRVPGTTLSHATKTMKFMPFSQCLKPLWKNLCLHRLSWHVISLHYQSQLTCNNSSGHSKADKCRLSILGDICLKQTTKPNKIVLKDCHIRAYQFTLVVLLVR